MSELHAETRIPSFFELYLRGEATADDIDDFVSRWHAGEEPWAKHTALCDYLGMTHEEYEVWLCDPLALPSILAARRSGRHLVEVMAERLDVLRAGGRRADAAIIHSLGHWVEQRRPL